MSGVRRALAAALAIGLLGAGCTLSQSVPEKRRFVLEAERPAGASQGCEGAVMVHRFRVAPLFERKRLVYRAEEDRYQARFYDEFYAPPGSLLRQATFDWVQAAGLFSVVLHPGDPGRPDWVLEARVDRLVADLTGGSPVAALDIGFALLRARDLEVAFARQYVEETPTGSEDPETVVEAWNRSLVNVLTRLEADLRTFLAAENACAP
jgi:cholesterol transport system auxiliary component